MNTKNKITLIALLVIVMIKINIQAQVYRNPLVAGNTIASYDMRGVVIETYTVSQTKAIESQILSLSGGLYLLLGRLQSGQVLSTKFVKL
jgi:hypothetical protein